MIFPFTATNKLPLESHSKVSTFLAHDILNHSYLVWHIFPVPRCPFSSVSVHVIYTVSVLGTGPGALLQAFFALLIFFNFCGRIRF